MSHPVQRFSQLLDEADRLKHQLAVLSGQRRQSGPPADYTPVITTYNRWAASTRALLPADLVERWTAALASERRGQTLPQLMANPAITPPMGIPSLPSLMSTVIEQQIKLLEVARLRAWPAPSAISEPTRYAIAHLLGGLARWTQHDHLFPQNGADPQWRTRPRKPDPAQIGDAPMAWMDGILAAAREQEVPILQGVLLDVTRHPRVPQERRDEARVLLDQLALVGAAGQVPPDAASEVLRQLTTLQQEMQALRERVQALEGQRAP